MRQIQKRTAFRLWMEGKEVYMLACKVRLGNPWILPYLMPTMDRMKNETFQTRIENEKVICENVTDSKKLFNMVYDNFACYNCNSELGKYIHFYID